MPQPPVNESDVAWTEPGSIVKLTQGRLSAELHPALGARIGRLCRHDETGAFDYLIPLDAAHFDPAKWQRAGCFPMLPYTNKFAGNTFAWGNQLIRVADPATPALLHGWGMRKPWRLDDLSDTHCTLTHAAPATESWPWAYRAELRVTLSPDGIDLSLELVNCSVQPMPVGLGLHPYFSIDSGLEAKVEAITRWQASATSDGLPVVRESLHEPLRLELQRHALPQATLTWFCETRETRAVIDYRDAGRRITLTSHQARHLVVHYRAGEQFLCLEPSSHLAGQLSPIDNAALPGVPVMLSMHLQLE
jgi:aldose 1-epimerase